MTGPSPLKRLSLSPAVRPVIPHKKGLVLEEDGPRLKYHKRLARSFVNALKKNSTGRASGSFSALSFSRCV